MSGDNGCDVLLLGYEAQENLGLRSVASFLMRNGVSVEIGPLQDVPRGAILGRINQCSPKIVGFSLIFQRMLDDFSTLITYLRDKGCAAHFTIGGHFPSFEHEYLLTTVPGLDSVVRHEGEETLLELFKNIDDPPSWKQIRGLAYRSHDEVVVNPLRPLIVDLDALPFPVRDMKPKTHRGIGIRSISGSRGCYYDCSFCSIHEFYRRPAGPGRRSRSPLNVVREMEVLFNEFNVRIFIFQDDDLFMRGQWHRQWLEDFLYEIKRRKMADQILWRVSCRIDDLDADLLMKMKGTGLASVYLGIESGSDQGLKTFNKRYCADDVYKAVGLLRDLDMPFEFGFMIFDPDSTLASIKENMKFLRAVGGDGGSLVHFCKMAPYAGTPIARRLAAEGRLEGTKASPDYRFKDPKLDLLQLFLSQTFNFRNFDDDGLVERLRFAKFDAAVVAKFFAKDYNARLYAGSVKELIMRCNGSALDIMSTAISFIENYEEDKIMAHWDLLMRLTQDEKETESEITGALDLLMQKFECESSLV